MKGLEAGYMLQARALQDSALWSLGAEAMRVAQDLLLQARWKDEPRRLADFEVRRGEVLTSYRMIAERTAWIERGAEKSFSAKKVQRIIAKLKDIGFCEKIERYKRKDGQAHTYGTHLNICNYKVYQNPDSYSRTEPHRTAQNRTEPTLTDIQENTGKEGEREACAKDSSLAEQVFMRMDGTGRFENLTLEIVANVLRSYPENLLTDPIELNGLAVEATAESRQIENAHLWLHRHISDLDCRLNGAGDWRDRKKYRPAADGDVPFYLKGLPKG